jgi:bifunctional non-homologous end joining protein LigD
MRTERHVNGRALTLTNLDRVLWPSIDFTKGDLVDYYTAVAPALLPHLAGRPLTMRRFPDGVYGVSWFQTECRGRPDWLPALRITGPTGKLHEFCVVNDLPALLWVVNLAAIELHPFLGAAPAPDRPTAVVFDLDPGAPASLLHCCVVALRIRAMLHDLGLDAWPKSSGMRGLHLYVPVSPELSYADTKTFARRVARQLVGERPHLIVDRSAVALRSGKVFVDWSQNDRMKSTVAPYSLRTAWRPSVSTPLTWDEIAAAVAAKTAAALVATPEAMVRRLTITGDLFAPILSPAVPRLQRAHLGECASTA